VAKVPPRPNGAYFAKDDFHIDVAARTCVCPAGERCRKVSSRGRIKGHDGRTYPRQVFQFSPVLCAVCPMRPQCVKATGFKGRTVSLHPQEALLQEARALQRSDEYGPYRKMRQVAEHRIARLMQLGMRQARYFGRVKTQAQLLLAATIANLTLIAKKMGYINGGSGGQTCVFSCALNHIALFATAIVTILTYPAYQLNFGPKLQSVEVGFRPDF